MVDTASRPASAAVQPRGIIILLTCLAALGPLSTDMYLPSLPALTGVFGTDVAMVQLTLSCFLVGFAISQLAYGPLSDRFGRKPVILAGLVLFLLASAACANAQTIGQLIAARILQAVGACSGPVLGRAVARDLYGREQAARVLALMATATALAPALAPMLGGWLHEWFGWQSTFVVLVGFSLATALAVWLKLKESNQRKDPHATRPGQLLANYATLLRNRLFLGYVSAVGLGYSGLFSYISGSSFVIVQVYDVPARHFAWFFGGPVLGFMCGTALTSRLTRRLGIDRMIRTGLGVTASAGLVMAAFAWMGPVFFGEAAAHGTLGLLATVLPVAVFMAGVGLSMPNAMAGAISPFPHMAGAASAVMGCLQMSVASVVGIGVAHFFDGTPRPMATSMALMGLLGLVSFRLLVRRPVAPS